MLFANNNNFGNGGNSFFSGGQRQGLFNSGGFSQTGSLFGSNQQSNNGLNMFGNSNNGNNSTLFGGSNNGGMFGGQSNMGGGLLGIGKSIGTFSHNCESAGFSKNKDGYPVVAINGHSSFNGKSLEELRFEDYVAIRTKQIPAQALSNLEAQWKKNSGQASNMGSSLLGSGNSLGGGNLFGSQTQNTGGLFGTQTQKPLFGGSSTGNLFGGSSNGILGQQTSGGLFGNTSGGLFGNNSGTGGLLNQNKTTGGLFGNNSTGGLFGSNNQQSTGLFAGLTGGNKTGGLFGGNTTGSLFGGSSTGGLFGSTGGLFSGQNSGGLFSGLNSNQKPGGLFSGLGNQQNGGLFGNGYNTLQGQQPIMYNAADIQQAQLLEFMNMYGTAQSNYNLFGKSLGSSSNKEEIFDNYESRKERILPRMSKRHVKDDSNPFDKFYHPRKHESSLNLRVPFKTKAKEADLLFAPRRHSDMHHEREALYQETYEEMGKRVRLNSHEDKTGDDFKKVYEAVTLLVVFNRCGEEKIYPMDIAYASNCLEIKKNVLNVAFEGSHISFSAYKLVFKNKFIKDYSKVREIGFKDNDKLHLVPDTEDNEDSQSTLSMSSSIGKEHVAPSHILPKLTKNYQTSPSMLRISRMTEEELANVEHFTIANENVKIIFEGKTDIRGLDLDEIVVLGHRSVEMYPERGNVTLPEPGRGLNKAATIEFYNWSVPKKYQDNLELYAGKLKKWADDQNALLRYYDFNQEIVCITVQNFGLKF